MPLSDEDRVMVEAFRDFVEGAVAADDRYGAVTRHDAKDETILASRFDAGESWWLEVALRPFVPEIRVGILTDDRSWCEEVVQVIQESGETPSSFVAAGFREAGLDWIEPQLDQFDQDGATYHFATPLPLDELGDVDWNDFRGKTVRMLEAYLIAFGPAIVAGEVEEVRGEEE